MLPRKHLQMLIVLIEMQNFMLIHNKQLCLLTYTHHRSHRCDWWRHTRGCPWARRSFLGIWFCKRAAGRWSPVTASLCPRNPPGTDSWPLEGNLHTRITSASLCTGHGYHLKMMCSSYVSLRAQCQELNDINFKNKKTDVYIKIRDRCWFSPHILSGASSSSRIGWLRKISLDLMQSPRTSASVICTIFPGRHPRTAKQKHREVDSHQGFIVK